MLHKQLIKCYSHAQFNLNCSLRVEKSGHSSPPCEGTLASNPWFSLMRKHVLYHQCNWSPSIPALSQHLKYLESHAGQRIYPIFLRIVFHRFISEQNGDILCLFYAKVRVSRYLPAQFINSFLLLIQFSQIHDFPGNLLTDVDEDLAEC